MQFHWQADRSVVSPVPEWNKSAEVGQCATAWSWVPVSRLAFTKVAEGVGWILVPQGSVSTSLF